MSLRWPSWLPFSPPVRPVSALSRPELSGRGPGLPQPQTLHPSCPPCPLGPGCAGPSYERPYLQLFHQLPKIGKESNQCHEFANYNRLFAPCCFRDTVLKLKKKSPETKIMIWHSSSVLTEVLPVQRLSSSTEKAFEETSVRSLWCLHRGE